MDPCMQISEVLLKVCRIGLPRQPVHPRGGVALEHEERLPEQIDAEVVEERCELLLPPLLSCFPYACERLGHTSPTLCPVCALLACIPLGPRPWLHRLRRRFPGIVRRLHGYYGGVRLPTVVHHRLRLLAFPMRTRAARVTSAAGRPWDLPVPVQEASAHARVCDHAGSSRRSLMARPCVCLRTARGQCGSLLLHRKGLPPSTPCRSPGALRNPSQEPTLERHPDWAFHCSAHAKNIGVVE